MIENDFISRSALLELAHNHVGGTVDCNDIARFPAVDAEPVRHGRWIDHGDYVTTAYGSLDLKICSNCNAEVTLDGYDYYCPNCGAKMDMEV